MKGQFFPYKDTEVSKTVPHVTRLIIIACTVIFLWSITDFENIIASYGFVPAQFAFATIFTSMFLHGSFGHLFGNMWYLWIFGDNVEDKLGKTKFAAFYILSGIFAAMVHYLTDPASPVPTIGASGAISGILGAYMVFFPKSQVHTMGPYFMTYTLPAPAMIGFWFILQLLFGGAALFGGQESGVAFFAHVGGFVFGYAAAKLYCQIH